MTKTNDIFQIICPKCKHNDAWISRTLDDTTVIQCKKCSHKEYC